MTTNGTDHKQAVIVTVEEKIPAERRDTFRQYVDVDEDWVRSVHNADDDSAEQLGKPAVYSVKLTPEGIRAFRDASNVRAIELDAEITTQVLTEHDNFEQAGEPADVYASYVPNGVENEVLDWCQIGDVEGPYPGAGVDVHVLDTGILAALREYFEGAIFHEKSYYGRSDATDPEASSHGTWCAGAAWPRMADLGIWQVLEPVQGSGSTSNIAAAQYAAADATRNRGRRGVISMSLGGPGYSQVMDDAALYGWNSGLITVAAAGNHNPSGPMQPVSGPGNGSNVFGVANFDHRANVIAPSSNQGPEIDLAAPGSKVRGLNGVKTGTSMSTPVVARGVACLLASGADLWAVWRAALSGALNTTLPIEVEGRGGMFRAGRSLRALGIG